MLRYLYIRSRMAQALRWVLPLFVAAAAGCAAKSGRPFSDYMGLDFTEFEEPAEVTWQARAKYPDIFIKAGLEGVVCLEVAVLSSGEPVGVRVVSGCYPILDQEAAQAARQSEYSPAKIGGVPTNGLALVEYTFGYAEVLMLQKDRKAQLRARPVWPSPRVSEVGEVYTTSTYKGWTHKSIRYNGIEVHGDLSVAMYDSIMTVCRPYMGALDEVALLYNYTAFDPRFRPDRVAGGDFMLHTCSATDTTGLCVAGKVFRLLLEGGKLELVSVTNLEQ